MKKRLAILLAVLLLGMMLIGCGQTNTPAEAAGADDKLNVVTSIFAPYDFVRQIAGDNAELTMLLPPASESHSFEPTPQDVITIQNCDVFIYVGGESDQWVGSILESMDTSNMSVITLMDCVEVVEEDIVEGMEDDEHEHEEEHADEEKQADEHADEEHAKEEVAYDEHVWTAPKNAKLIVEKISEALCSADADNAGTYRQNTTAYLAKLDELDAEFQAVVDSAQRKTIVFGDRFPFRYFADAYGLEYFAAFPGCSTETEASAATVAFLIDKINEEQIPVVFHIELGNTDMASAISEATGAKSLLMHACHNITRDDFTGGVTYIDLMTQNVDTLKEALQ